MTRQLHLTPDWLLMDGERVLPVPADLHPSLRMLLVETLDELQATDTVEVIVNDRSVIVGQRLHSELMVHGQPYVEPELPDDWHVIEVAIPCI